MLNFFCVINLNQTNQEKCLQPHTAFIKWIWNLFIKKGSSEENTQRAKGNWLKVPAIIGNVFLFLFFLITFDNKRNIHFNCKFVIEIFVLIYTIVVLPIALKKCKII